MGKRYFYKVDGKEFGPVSVASFANILREGGIDPRRVLFRSEERHAWTRADKIKLDGIDSDTDAGIDISLSTKLEMPPVEVHRPSMFRPVETVPQTSSDQARTLLRSPMTRAQGWVVIGILLAISLWTPLFGPSHSALQWEYKISSPSDLSFHDEINRLGKEGWELVSARRATSGDDQVSYEMIFKRPIGLSAGQ